MDEPVTKSQLAYIMELQEFSYIPVPEFTGTTKREASEYISRWSTAAHYDFARHGGKKNG